MKSNQAGHPSTQSDDLTRPDSAVTAMIGQEGRQETTTKQDTFPSRFKAFLQEFRSQELPFSVSERRVSRIVTRESAIDSTYVAEFLTKSLAFEKHGEGLLYIPPLYGERLPLSDNYITVTYAWTYAPNIYYYLSNFALEGKHIDDVLIGAERVREPHFTTSEILSADEILILNKTYVEEDTVRVDSTWVHIRPSGRIVEGKE